MRLAVVSIAIPEVQDGSDLTIPELQDGGDITSCGRCIAPERLPYPTGEGTNQVLIVKDERVA